jgi:flagellar hook assembly protein FlgD
VDQVGNQSVVERDVFVKLQPPPISLTTVEDGQEVHEPSLLVAGQTEVGATVRVNGQEATVDVQGGFQSVVNLVEGLNLVRVEAIDQAGNTSRATTNVTYTAAPAQPAGATLRTTLMAGGAGAALVLALWILLGGLYGPNSLSINADQPFLSSNPFEGRDLRFHLELARPARTVVHVYDHAGERVATLMNRQRQRAGVHTLEWDGMDERGQLVPDGVYEVEASASTIFTTVTNRLSVYKVSERLPRVVVQHGAQPLEEIDETPRRAARWDESISLE